MKGSLLISSAMMAGIAFATPLQNIRLDSNIDTRAVEDAAKVISYTNEIGVIGVVSSGLREVLPDRLHDMNGIVFDVYEDGKVMFYFNDPISDINPLDRIMLNDKTLNQEINDRFMFNPLFGKKLAIIGDSQSCSPSKDKCYAGLIAKRNHMEYVNKGIGGTKLAAPVTISGQVVPAIIDSYTNDIPADADFILIQAGYNDTFNRDVPDDSLDRSTFKGCWNLLLTDLKTRYPNATCGIMLPYSWMTSRVERVEWMKTRCDKYGYEYFDQTPLFTTNQVQYFSEGVAFAVHLSDIGARKVSYPIEQWMKTTMNIYNDNLYK